LCIATYSVTDALSLSLRPRAPDHLELTRQRGQEQQRRWDDATNPKGNYMRTSFGPLLGLAFTLVSTPAFADDAPAPAPAITITGGATLVSDYRFRGISQTDKNFAVQGTFTVAHKSGLYATVWGSSISGYIANGSNQEIDLIAGYKTTYKGTTFDIGGLYYFYPNSQTGSVLLGGGKYYSDFFEPYADISHTFGPVTAKITANYSPKQRALALIPGIKKDNLYGALDLSSAIPHTPLSVSAHLGHNFSKSFLSAGKAYTDWNVGISYTYKALTFGVQYVDTNFAKNQVTSLIGRDIAKAGVVGSIGVAF